MSTADTAVIPYWLAIIVSIGYHEKCNKFLFFNWNFCEKNFFLGPSKLCNTKIHKCNRKPFKVKSINSYVKWKFSLFPSYSNLSGDYKKTVLFYSLIKIQNALNFFSSLSAIKVFFLLFILLVQIFGQYSNIDCTKILQK